MRVTIIKQDGIVAIDGVPFNGIDLSTLDPSIHAVQWFGDEGEVEVKDERGRMVENRQITSFDEFTFVIPLWEQAKAKDEKDKAEFAALVKSHEDLAIEMETQAAADAAQIQAQAVQTDVQQ